ncbi:MAG TPA: hypothetical protein DCS91_07905 [Microcoleaceae bacterium UBA11344]|nr:hypothetical protein [Microcoleaceae cyanobacterium UBA11344]
MRVRFSPRPLLKYLNKSRVPDDTFGTLIYMGHGAWGMGHGAWGMGNWAWGIGHGAWVAPHK